MGEFHCKVSKDTSRNMDLLIPEAPQEGTHSSSFRPADRRRLRVGLFTRTFLPTFQSTFQ